MQQPPLPTQPPLPNETPSGPSNLSKPKQNNKPKQNKKMGSKGKKRNHRGRNRQKRRKRQRKEEHAAIAASLGVAGKPKKELWKKYSELTAAEKQEREENQIKRAKYQEYRGRIGAGNNNNPSVPRAPHNTTQFLMEETGEQAMPPLFEGMPLQEMGSMSMEVDGIDCGSSEEFSNDSDENAVTPRVRQNPASDAVQQHNKASTPVPPRQRESDVSSSPRPVPAVHQPTTTAATSTPRSSAAASRESIASLSPILPAHPAHASTATSTRSVSAGHSQTESSSRRRLHVGSVRNNSASSTTSHISLQRSHASRTATDGRYHTNSTDSRRIQVVQSPQARTATPGSKSLVTSAEPQPPDNLQHTELQHKASTASEHQLSTALDRVQHLESMCQRLRTENLALRSTVGMMAKLISSPMVQDT